MRGEKTDLDDKVAWRFLDDFVTAGEMQSKHLWAYPKGLPTGWKRSIDWPGVKVNTK